MPPPTATTETTEEKKEEERYVVLIEFVYRHLDFQLAELDSVLSMYDIHMDGPDCLRLPLPGQQPQDIPRVPRWRSRSAAERTSSSPQDSTTSNNSANDSSKNALPTKPSPSPLSASEESQKKEPHRPFCILSFPASQVKRHSQPKQTYLPSSTSRWHNPGSAVLSTSEKNGDGDDTGVAISDIILANCTLVRSVVELWGCSVTLDECVSATHQWTNHTTIGSQLFHQVASTCTTSTASTNPKPVATASWKMTIHTLGTKYTRQEQDDMRFQFANICLDRFQGPVQMVEPDHEMVLIREMELDRQGSPVIPRASTPLSTSSTTIDEQQKSNPPSVVVEKENDNNDERHSPPLAVYFGRVLGGTRSHGRGLDAYSLNKRPYLGPTSMDAELSFVMASLGQVQKGSVVLDPFVGTGSILLSCTLRGAYPVGSDIDIRVLRGKNQNETIFKNFEHFHLPRPELLRTDNAIYHRHFRTHRPFYDAIVCDPPYGIRAGARKTGSRHSEARKIPEEHRHDHIPQTKPYPVSDVMSDLLDVAARVLVIGGRLVYVIPSFVNFHPESDLPRHECLKLMYCCYQPLGQELGRRIVVMQKCCEYDETKRQEYTKHVWVNGKESADKCANIREKILEAAKKKPGYQEKLSIRKQKRKATKEARKKAKTTDTPTKS